VQDFFGNVVSSVKTGYGVNLIDGTILECKPYVKEPYCLAFMW
jgi:hypothetical protein